MHWSAARLFRLACFAFIAGIACASFMPQPWLRFAVGWFAVAAAGIMAGVVFRERTVKRVPWYAFFIMLGVAAAGVWRYALSGEVVTPRHIAYYNGQAVTFAGSVTADPEVRARTQRLVVAGHALVAPAGGTVAGLVQVIVPRYPEYAAGDQVTVTCELQAPEPFADFAYDRYLARYGIYAVCFYPRELAVTGRQPEWQPLLAAKRMASAALDRGLPDPHAGVVQAMVLGNRGRLADEVQDDFARAGLSHILAISGMHIALVAGMVVYVVLAAGLWRQQALGASVAIVWLYILMIGAPASAARAGVMVTVVAGAVALRRLNVLGRALLYAAVVLLAVNPRLLRDDVGFQLSFLAVGGIAALQPFWSIGRERLKRRLPVPLRRFGLAIGDIAAITVAAQALTLPVVLWNFGILSASGLAANLATVWLVPGIMAGAALATAASWAVPALGWVWFAPVRGMVGYLLAVADWASAGAWEVGRPSLWLVGGYYVAAWGVYKYFRKNLSPLHYSGNSKSKAPNSKEIPN